MISLDKWSDQVMPKLPWECPQCGKKLPQIRFVTDHELMVIRMTEVTHERRIHRALCPDCGKQLDSYTYIETRPRP